VSAPYCQHDLLDWFAAIGPTVATLAAVAATIWAAYVGRQVSRDALRLQRQLSGPRLSILERARSNPGSGLEWIAEIRNDGQTAANLKAFRVVVDGKVFDHRSGEEPAEYWGKVLQALGVIRYGSLEGNVLRPPNAIPAGKTELLFQVTLVDPATYARSAMRKLRIEVEYFSLWGEQYPAVHVFGGI
jgi:hypothetical protein